MKHIRDIWQVVLADPLIWLFDCFFQPSKLRGELKRYYPLARMIPCLRLALPLFLVSYPFAVTLKIVISLFLSPSVPPIIPLLLTIALNIAVITIISTVVGIVGDV